MMTSREQTLFSVNAVHVNRAREEALAKKEAKRLSRKASHESSKAFGE